MSNGIYQLYLPKYLHHFSPTKYLLYIDRDEFCEMFEICDIRIYGSIKMLIANLQETVLWHERGQIRYLVPPVHPPFYF